MHFFPDRAFLKMIHFSFFPQIHAGLRQLLDLFVSIRVKWRTHFVLYEDLPAIGYSFQNNNLVMRGYYSICQDADLHPPLDEIP